MKKTPVYTKITIICTALVLMLTACSGSPAPQDTVEPGVFYELTGAPVLDNQYMSAELAARLISAKVNPEAQYDEATERIVYKFYQYQNMYASSYYIFNFGPVRGGNLETVKTYAVEVTAKEILELQGTDWVVIYSKEEQPGEVRPAPSESTPQTSSSAAPSTSSAPAPSANSQAAITPLASTEYSVDYDKGAFMDWPIDSDAMKSDGSVLLAIRKDLSGTECVIGVTADKLTGTSLADYTDIKRKKFINDMKCEATAAQGFTDDAGRTWQYITYSSGDNKAQGYYTVSDGIGITAYCITNGPLSGELVDTFESSFVTGKLKVTKK